MIKSNKNRNEKLVKRIRQYVHYHPTKQHLYGHLPHIMKTIKIRRTRHEEHCWRSRDELISDVLLRTPSHGREKTRWPARTYIQYLCADTGCNPENLPEAMDDREGWQERVRDICADSATWWCWYIIIILAFLFKPNEINWWHNSFNWMLISSGHFLDIQGLGSVY